MQVMSWTRMLQVVGVGVVLLAMAGCHGNQRQEWVDQADNRWLTLRSGVMLDLASQQFEAGDLAMAEKTLGEAMQMDPANPRLHVLAGRILLEQGRLERSYHLFNVALDLNEELPEAYYYQGLVLQRWQEYQRAHDNYRRAYELEADNVSYLLAQMEMLVQIGQLPEAESVLRSRLNYFDQSAAMRAALGHVLVMQGRANEAVPFIRQASLLDPEDLQAREQLAMALLSAGEHAQAARELAHLLDEPEMADRHDLRRLLARAHVRLERFDRARAAYLELARGPAAEAGDWIKLAELAWRAEDHGAAFHAATRAIDMAPSRHEGYLIAGMSLHQRGRLDEALSMFDRAAERAPGQAMPLIMRGLALQQAERYAAAAEAYEAALALQPENERARRLLESVSAQ